MRSQRSVVNATRSARVRVASPLWSQLAKLVFHRHPRREWGTYFRFGFRRTPWGLAIGLVDLLPPRPGELDRQSAIVSFSPDYISRAVDERDLCRLGIGFVHSHPLGWGVVPSASDDDMDEYFARLSGPYGNGQPYLSLIVNRDTTGEPLFSGRVYDQGEWLPISHLHIVGAELRRYSHNLANGLGGAVSPLSRQVLSRWAALVGDAKVESFCGATIGFVGCSGTGSPSVETIARAQVKNYVLIDEQRAAVSNLERMHGLAAADIETNVPPYKVDVMERLIRSINPSANITKIVGNALDDLSLDHLLRCDLVLGLTDTVHGRALLGDLASLYLVPSIDVGVLPRGRGGRLTSQLVEVTRYAVGEACPYCQGRVPPAILNAELMSPEEKEGCRAAAAAAIARGEDGTVYWQGELPQIPSVGYLTTMAGALAAGYGLNWLLGTAGMPHQRIQFDVGQPEFAFAGIETPRLQYCACAKWAGYSDQGERSITLPAHFPRAFKLD